jgi:predicted thioesterase
VERVCSGTHRRFIVDVERLRARVQKKTASMPAVA